MILVTVRFFALARDLAGTESAPFELPNGATASHMMQLLVDRYPPLGRLKGQFRLAVNSSYADASTALRQNDEVAVIPPVSGG